MRYRQNSLDNLQTWVELLPFRWTSEINKFTLNLEGSSFFMPRSNVTAKQKLDAVKKILSGEESRRHIGQIYGVAHSSVEEWILK